MNVFQFFRILWARRYLIVAATISCLIGAFVAIQIMPPRYQAQSRVILELLRPDPVTGEVTSPRFAGAYTKTQLELIQDYRVAGRVVDNLGWANDLNMIAQYQARPAGDDRDLRRWLAQRIIDGTNASLISGSNILQISYTANTPETARSIADALREAYIESSLAFRRESASQTAEWYATQTQKAKVALDAAEKAKSDYERENDVILADNATDIDSARLQALAGAGAAAPIVTPAVGPTPSSIQLGQVDAAIAQASRTLGPNHPDLLAMKQQREVLARQAAQERATASAAAGAAASAARVTADMLEAQKSKVMAQRDKVERLRQLQAEVNIRREQFTRAASRTAALRQEAEIGDAGITRLDGATTPRRPIFPNVPLILGGGAALGLGFGILVALITELLGRRVRGIEDLSVLDAPVLGVVSASGAATARKKSGRFGRKKTAGRQQGIVRA